MRPCFTLDGTLLRANVTALRAQGAPVAAVLKNDGYGWGAARIAREIDGLVESYVVAEATEFWALRMHTRKPIRLLADTAPGEIAAICTHGGIPNVAAAAGLDAAAAYAETAGHPVVVRVGIVDAAGWAGLTPVAVAPFAGRCAGSKLKLELWTHLASPSRAAVSVAAFDAAVSAIRASGVAVVAVDIASTAWVSPELARSRVRVGAGLFGGHLGAKLGVRCAIRVEAPVVAWHAPGSVAWAGYGENAVPAHRGVAVLRCDYGDGFPKKLTGYDDILSIGMQYTSRLADNPNRAYVLIDAAADLDALAARLDIGVHELITGLARHS